jgi:hypothetical protein
MAAPNIVNVANIYAKTTYLTPAVTTAVVLLANPAASNKVLKVNQVLAANVDGTNSINATVSIYTNGAVAQGSAPSGGTAYPIIFTVAIPAGATLNVLDKSTAVYLEEGTSITVTSGTASKITYTVSYEDIS